MTIPLHTLISLTSLSSIFTSSMASESSEEVAHDFSPFIKVYKDGRIERLMGNDVVPPSLDPKTNVQSKDVAISLEYSISARLYLPEIPDPTRKLPVLVYFHGGGFVVETPYSPHYHSHLNDVASASNVLAVSVHYRRAPEHPVPTAHDDSWISLKWIASHHGGAGPEEWLNRHADLDRVFVAGDSAGANIAHHMAIRVGSEGLPGLNIIGAVLIHPYFWGSERVGAEKELPPETTRFADELWRFSYPMTTGSDDPILNPEKDPKLGKLGCKKVLVCVAEKDFLKDRGLYYKEILEKSEWEGHVEVMEAVDENHVFHLYNPTCENAVALLNRLVAFFNQD